jgi:glycosyltransferase involved in cell wall biosynthesis
MTSILIFCKTFLKGGAEKQALTLARLLSEQNLEVVLVGWCGDQIDPANREFIDKYSLEYKGLSGNPLKKFLELNRIIKKRNIRVVLSYLTLANFAAGISGMINRNAVTIGGIRTEQFPLFKFVFERFVHNWLNDATVFNNYSAKAKFEKRGFRSDRIRVIHNSINVQPFEKLRSGSEEIKIISVCRFVKAKDFHTALHSFQKVTVQNPGLNLKYYLVGYGPLEKEIRSMIAELGIADRVVIMINPKGIPAILKSCDIYLSTSLFEGLSNSIMEAMAACLPVIATDVGDSSYLVHDRQNGFIVKCRDIAAIVEKMNYLVNNSEARREMGTSSYELISSEFSESRLTDNYLALLSEYNIDVIPERK